jgi:hypothetical protein
MLQTFFHTQFRFLKMLGVLSHWLILIDQFLLWVTAPQPWCPRIVSDRVRWGQCPAGLAIALSTPLVLSAIGAAIGRNNIAGSGSLGRCRWCRHSRWGLVHYQLVDFTIHRWVDDYPRTCGPNESGTALLNGAILWATTLAVSAWLLSSVYPVRSESWELMQESH